MTDNVENIEKVSIREFRNHMAKYTANAVPFAVIKHGHTVGYYIPVHVKPAEKDYENLQIAAEALEKMMLDAGLSEETLLEDFKALRKEK
jgi:hypothetical protein